jgi:formylglycine-generating enzyme
MSTILMYCRLSHLVAFGCTAFILSLVAVAAYADVFNMGGTRNPDGTWNGLASLGFVTVGDPGNAANADGYGAVGYTYQMGQYDVTAAQYAMFLNDMAAISDPYRLYTTDMATGYAACGISQTVNSGTYSYSVTPGHDNFPVNYVSWGNAARFCNWLQNGQPIGAEGNGTTETGAYTLNGWTDVADLMTVTHNTGAKYFIPTENEWYKATYYKGHGTNASYWLYPTKSDVPPINTLSSSGTNNANFYDYYGTGNGGNTDPPNYLTSVGTFASSPGPYGTFD